MGHYLGIFGDTKESWTAFFFPVFLGLERQKQRRLCYQFDRWYKAVAEEPSYNQNFPLAEETMEKPRIARYD